MNATMKSSASIVIIGGGIQGLAIAFNLAREGARNVRVLDAGYFQGGASGRNGTVIRGGFGSVEWTQFFAHSNRLWADLSRTLGENVMFTRRGYLIIAQSPATMARLEGMHSLHHEHGLDAVLLSAKQVKALEPAVDESVILGAIHLRDGGAAPHHAAMKGYLAAGRRLGVQVEYGRPVNAIERKGDTVIAVTAGSERITCDSLVIAAGAYSVDVGKLAEAEIAGFPMRIEAMALEPVRPIIKSAIALPDRLCYFHQTARGEIVGGAEVAERPQVTLRSDISAIAATAAAYAELFPCLGGLRILRQWAGMLHATPDWGPLLGRHPDIRNLWLSAGWSYGFAGAPAAGDLLAKAITTDTVDPRMTAFAVDRFRRNQPVAEGAIVLAPVD
jgi:sarcosine oxidase subunit beta